MADLWYLLNKKVMHVLHNITDLPLWGLDMHHKCQFNGQACILSANSMDTDITWRYIIRIQRNFCSLPFFMAIRAIGVGLFSDSPYFNSNWGNSSQYAIKILFCTSFHSNWGNWFLHLESISKKNWKNSMTIHILIAIEAIGVNSLCCYNILFSTTFHSN